MIEEVKKKIHFSPYFPQRGKEKDESPAPTVTINRKHNKLIFNRSCIDELSMDAKFIRLYYEPSKHIIGWQIKSVLPQLEMKNWKLVRKNKQNGVYTVQIKKMLEEFNGLRYDSYKHLPVKKYIEQEGIMEKGSTYYFVEMIEDPQLLRLGLGNPSVTLEQTVA